MMANGATVPLPFAGVYNYANSKIHPGTSTGLDLARNKDYYGKAIRTGGFPVNVLQMLEYAAEGTLPLTAGTAMEGVRRGETEQIPSQVASQFAGVNMVPEDQVYKMKVRWQADVKAYNELPTSTIEAKAKRLLTRAQYRARNPQVEAKLFITGQVSSVSSYPAANEVIRLVGENDIKPDAISGVQKNVAEQKKRAELGVRDTNITWTDRLVRRLMLPPAQPTGAPQPTPVMRPTQTSIIPIRWPTPTPWAAPTVAPTARARSRDEQQWQMVRPSLDSTLLSALAKVWGGGSLDPTAEKRLRGIYQEFPFGAPTFEIWLRQTLRQIQENAAVLTR